MDMINVGIIGCGNISHIYLHNLSNTFKTVNLVACADLDIERAKAKAEEKDENGNFKYPGVKGMSVDDLLADPSIKIVVNLTTPQAHFPVAKKVIEAGKSVHNEKPLTLTREEANELKTLAEKNGVMLGGAPDTFLGAGIQSCRKFIDDGLIGSPVCGTAFMGCHGHESWHPAPDFYYKKGGGPLLDMGPYYITALVSLLGPVKEVCSMTSAAFDERVCTAASTMGHKISVEVETHVSALLRFDNGAIINLVTSFDIWKHSNPLIEIHGTMGSMSVPDPNGFGGAVKLSRSKDDWKEMPLTHPYAENSRGVGPADMAAAIREGRKPKAGSDLAYHVLDVMLTILEAAKDEGFKKVESTCARPEPMDEGSYGAL